MRYLTLLLAGFILACGCSNKHAKTSEQVVNEILKADDIEKQEELYKAVPSEMKDQVDARLREGLFTGDHWYWALFGYKAHLATDEVVTRTLKEGGDESIYGCLFSCPGDVRVPKKEMDIILSRIKADKWNEHLTTGWCYGLGRESDHYTEEERRLFVRVVAALFPKTKDVKVLRMLCFITYEQFGREHILEGKKIEDAVYFGSGDLPGGMMGKDQFSRWLIDNEEMLAGTGMGFPTNGGRAERINFGPPRTLRG